MTAALAVSIPGAASALGMGVAVQLAGMDGDAEYVG